ncbi:MAG TPA: hypothetical protein VKS79_22355 [Gemmataceae bacterium]|nr:hypothetical protein [Gemmataceae bacterium]
MKLSRTALIALAICCCALMIAREAAAQQNPPLPRAQPNVQAQGAMIEGQVVKVVGQDQVMVRTSDGKEVLVHVNPQTKYMLTAQGGAFTDLKPNAFIGVQYTPQNQLNMATQIVGLQQVQGQVVRVVGKDQLVIKTADGKEVTVYVSPETIYQLAATIPPAAVAPPVPTLATLQPGWPVTVYTQDNVVRTGPFGRRVVVNPRR